jgi:hypothetical protein
VLQVATEHVGKPIRCPVCQAVQTVRIPEAVPAAAPAETYQVEQVVKCPKCRKEWPPNTVVCVGCGYNFKTGEKLKTRYKVRDRYVDVGVPFLGTYTRYAVSRDADGRVKFSKNQWLLWLPVGKMSVDLNGYDSVATDYTAGDNCDWFYLELQGPQKRPMRLWEGSKEETMHQLVDLLKDTAGLTVKRK